MKNLKCRNHWMGLIGYVLYASIGWVPLTETEAMEAMEARTARWHASGASAHVWRGITRHDNVTMGTGIELGAYGFRTHAWGFIRGDELDKIADQGVIADTELAFMYRFPLRSLTLDLGYSEYMYNVGPENTRELFANMVIPFNRYLDLLALLAYDIGVHDDYYVRSGIRVHAEIARPLTLFTEATMAAAGKGFSIGPKGGAHDYGIRAGLSHEINPRLRWGMDMQWTGSLDKDVLPKQKVISFLTIRLAVDI